MADDLEGAAFNNKIGEIVAQVALRPAIKDFRV